jgi:ADP-heptose:LPS heptosyltransferase
MPEKLRLINKTSPGDCLIMTGAIECLHEQHPQRYLTDVRTSCDAIFENSPRITRLKSGVPDVREIEMHCPLIHLSDRRPVHFLEAYVDYLAEQLEVKLTLTTNRPHLYLSKREKSWISQVHEITGAPGKYWIVNAGTKQDYTCKGWGHSNYQQVIDELHGRIQFVQVGEKHHLHKPLRNVINLIGRTDARQLIRLCWHAQGALGPITFIQHIFGAFEKPYVALSGGREPVMWEYYPTQTTLDTVGKLPCCQYGGCWRSRVVPLGDGDPKDKHLCERPVYGDEVVPKCMAMIQPRDAVRAILSYYEGGVLKF